jgi:hypothetical protein
MTAAKKTNFTIDRKFLNYQSKNSYTNNNA